MSESSERSSPQRSEPEGPLGLLRRRPDGSAPTKWWAVAVIGGVLLVGSGWLLTNSPVFAARHIEISGQSHLSRSTLLRLAAVHERTNLFWFHGDVVERRLEANPWVAEATVSRSLPSTLRIEIRERKPVALVMEGEDFLLVAADGTVLAPAPQ